MNEPTTTTPTDTEPNDRITYKDFVIEPREVLWNTRRMIRYVIIAPDGNPTGNAALTIDDAKAIVDRMIVRAEMLREIQEMAAATALIRNDPEIREIVSNRRKLGRRTQAEIDAMLV